MWRQYMTNRRQQLVAMCLLLLGAFIWSPAPATAGGNVIRFGTEAAFPPLNFVGKDGRLTGFDIDLGNALCDAVGSTCEWVVADWDALVSGLDEGKFDAILSSMPITPAHRELIDFTDSYHLQPASFAASETLAGLEISKETLSGKTIGVAAGTPHEAFLKDNFGDIATLKTYDLVAQAALDLTDARIDLIFGDRIVLVDSFLTTEQGKGFRLVGPSYTDAEWFGSGAGIAVRKGDHALRVRLNRGLKMLRADGTYRKINDRYFDFDIYGS